MDRSSSSHIRADRSEGARQSPRGDSDPPADTFGPLGSAERLNWLNAEKRWMKTSSQRVISGSASLNRSSAGKPGGHAPASASRQACQARKAILEGRKPYRST